MSIIVGVYDFFSYTIPGVFYLYIINEILRLLGQNFVDFNKLDNIVQILLIAVLAYVMGHLFDYIGTILWYRPLTKSGKKKMSVLALEKVKKNHPKLEIKIQPDDWGMVFAFIRKKDFELSQSIDKREADCIMLRNLSFALVLFSLMQVGLFIASFSSVYLLVALLSLGLSFVALKKSVMFHEWFFIMIYEQGVIYRKSLEEILNTQPHETERKPGGDTISDGAGNGPD